MGKQTAQVNELMEKRRRQHEKRAFTMEPLNVTFRYDEIRSVLERKNSISLKLETTFRTASHEECVAKNVFVVGCEVVIWFSKDSKPLVFLVPKGYLIPKIDITRIVRDTNFYTNLTDIGKERFKWSK